MYNDASCLENMFREIYQCTWTIWEIRFFYTFTQNKKLVHDFLCNPISMQSVINRSVPKLSTKWQITMPIQIIQQQVPDMWTLVFPPSWLRSGPIFWNLVHTCTNFRPYAFQCKYHFIWNNAYYFAYKIVPYKQCNSPGCRAQFYNKQPH